MTQKIIGFFCGPHYSSFEDASFRTIQKSITSDTTLLASDGSPPESGWSLWGIEEKADQFVADLKLQLKA